MIHFAVTALASVMSFGTDTAHSAHVQPILLGRRSHSKMNHIFP